MSKRAVVLSLFFGSALLLVLANGASAAPAMSGGKHDFTDGGTYNLTGIYICEPCHSPHSTNSVADAPLWNHTTTTHDGAYTLYSSGSLHAAVLQPGGSDVLCLSCHDGSVNWDAYGGGAGTATIAAALQAGAGGDLQQTHPISFHYDGTLVSDDGGLVTPGTDTVGTVALPLYAIGAGTKDVMRCSTCHDPHGNAALTSLLREPAATLCEQCHQK